MPVTFRPMNLEEMKTLLEQQGAVFVQGKGVHIKVFLNGKRSVLPVHGTRELGRGLEAAIKRQLGMQSGEEEKSQCSITLLP